MYKIGEKAKIGERDISEYLPSNQAGDSNQLQENNFVDVRFTKPIYVQFLMPDTSTSIGSTFFTKLLLAPTLIILVRSSLEKKDS